MNIREQRMTAGRMSQIKLSRESGVSRFRISLAECGQINLRDDELLAIQRALAREVRKLVNGFHGPAFLTGSRKDYWRQR